MSWTRSDNYLRRENVSKGGRGEHCCVHCHSFTPGGREMGKLLGAESVGSFREAVPDKSSMLCLCRKLQMWNDDYRYTCSSGNWKNTNPSCDCCRCRCISWTRNTLAALQLQFFQEDHFQIRCKHIASSADRETPAYHAHSPLNANVIPHFWMFVTWQMHLQQFDVSH